MSKGEDRSHGQAEGITRTCAVLRVRGKGRRSGANQRSRSKEKPSEAARGSAKRSQNASEGKAKASHLDNPIFPVTIA